MLIRVTPVSYTHLDVYKRQVDNSKDNGRFKLVKEEGAYGTAPKWLEVNAAELTAKVVALPQRRCV